MRLDPFSSSIVFINSRSQKEACLEALQTRSWGLFIAHYGQMLEPDAPPLAELRRRFALAPGLGTLIVSAPARLAQDPRLLNFTTELLECYLK